MINSFVKEYSDKISNVFQNFDKKSFDIFCNEVLSVWKNHNSLFLCGNGGSAGNATHLANDFLYSIGKGIVPGLKVESLSANPSVITCLGNDIGYDKIFSEQLKAKGNKNDLLICLSGSGNSKNIINAINQAKKQKIKTFGIIGFDGGKAKKILDHCIHIEINDMQVAEDMQLIVGHMCMQWISKSI